jgi:hypothetical protein
MPRVARSFHKGSYNFLMQLTEFPLSPCGRGMQVQGLEIRSAAGEGLSLPLLFAFVEFRFRRLVHDHRFRDGLE